MSPWIVTMEALAPYRQPWTRAADHPQPLPYLLGSGTISGPTSEEAGALIELTASGALALNDGSTVNIPA